MVQKIAKEMIQLARQEAAQDIYLIPKSSCYELYMRVGDERRFIQTYDFDVLSSVISHFKFVSGMNVGEKRRSQLGSCDYDCGDVTVSLRLSTVGITVAMRAWSFGSYMMRSVSCVSGLTICLIFVKK